jgi:uncharacterized protein with ATP-grasp and redox domains
MKIADECVTCIINQSQRVADAIDADKVLRKKLLDDVTCMSKNFSYELSPPEIAADVYAHMAEVAQRRDLYEQVKQKSTKKAYSFVPFLKKKLQASSKKLLTATKIAVAGNVIDLAAAVSFDLADELEKIFHTPFAHDDFKVLQERLPKVKKLLILGDNVGEHIFDALFVETLLEIYPHLEIFYMVRGKPIINDVTIKEAKEAGFESLCTLVDSGVDTPGFAYKRATKEAQDLFDGVDLVISKGMGNYECLSPSHRDGICFLLKVKCNVVADSLGREVGDIVCKFI